MTHKVLVSGLTGFVGQNLRAYLMAHCIDCLALTREELAIVEPNFLDGATAVVHLAGKAHDLKRTSNPNEYYEVNFEFTKNLYDAFLKAKAKKFIFISSVKAVADSVDGILTEDATPSPRTHYGKSKLMAEEYIMSQPLPEGKTYYILRPCMIHGPGNKGNLNLLYEFVKKGVPYPLAGYENKRSFLSVYNLCFVIKALLERDIPSGAYNVADDEALSTNKVITILAESLKKKAKLWAIPPSWVQFISRIGDKIKLPLNTERLSKLTENYLVSNAKIKKSLNQNLPLTSTEGLKITAESFGNYNNR